MPEDTVDQPKTPESSPPIPTSADYLVATQALPRIKADIAEDIQQKKLKGREAYLYREKNSSRIENAEKAIDDTKRAILHRTNAAEISPGVFVEFAQEGDEIVVNRAWDTKRDSKLSDLHFKLDSPTASAFETIFTATYHKDPESGQYDFTRPLRKEPEPSGPGEPIKPSPAEEALPDAAR